MKPVYCVKCHKKTKNEGEGKVVLAKNGAHMWRGKCAVCGTSKVQIVSKDTKITGKATPKKSGKKAKKSSGKGKKAKKSGKKAKKSGKKSSGKGKKAKKSTGKGKKAKKSGKKAKKTAGKKAKGCGAGKVRNPATNRCVKKSGAVGKSL